MAKALFPRRNKGEGQCQSANQTASRCLGVSARRREEHPANWASVHRDGHLAKAETRITTAPTIPREAIGYSWEQ
eukprot:2869460-Pleurochrysis_carterae.AAC.2